MGHPEIDNQTPYAFEALYIADEEMRPVVTPIIRATFDILPRGELELAEEQLPIDFVGQHHGKPGASSYRLEPDVAFMKPSTDVVLLGHAHAPRARATSVDVVLRVGPVSRTARVTGDRVWQKRMIGASQSDPESFETLPLTYERAFGGWDRTPENPEHHAVHPGNPVGIGFRTRHARLFEGDRLPNIEDPTTLLTSFRGSSTPAGFGFLCPHWEPRRLLAGTYDVGWQRSRMPLLPKDFDRRFFNAASQGLVAPYYLSGTEPVQITGASPEGRLDFSLPGFSTPVCKVSLRDRADERLETHLDTVVIDLDRHKLLMTWRSYVTLRDGPLDVRAIEVTAEKAPARRPALISNVVPLRPMQAV